MENDKEMLDAFAEEMRDLHNQLTAVVEGLKKDKTQKKLYEQFGLVIDRIYGTATTLGFMELGNYGRTMKGICYQCSQSDSEIGQKKVLNMLMSGLGFIDQLIKGIHNQAEAKKICFSLHLETQKAELLSRGAFHGITRKSVA